MKNRVRSKEIVVQPDELRKMCEHNQNVVFRAEVRHSRIDLSVHAENKAEEGQEKSK